MTSSDALRLNLALRAIIEGGSIEYIRCALLRDGTPINDVAKELLDVIAADNEALDSKAR